MEHLLLPRGATLTSRERLEYIAEPYDGQDFLTFPERSRFAALVRTLLPEGDLPRYRLALAEQDELNLEIFLQTWLIFGLLHEVFGEKATVQLFTTTAQNGTVCVNTAKLSHLVDEWVVQHYHLNERGKDLLEHLLKCIWEAYSMLMVVRSRLDQTLLWTISSICETLEEVILETLDKGTRSQPTAWKFYNTDDNARLMTEHNWCPADVRIWREHWLGFQAMVYMSKIEQPKIKDHSRCEGQICVANQYDVTNQRTVHRCAGGDCDSVSVDVDLVTTILAEGYIALLDINVDADERIHIEVLSSKNDLPYVALSHVWADGLGNPNGNALPKCQLLYVARAVHNLAREAGQKRLLLWLDTLCCPVASLPHRLICITRMRQIYEAATYVLVLEAALAQYNSFDLDIVELAARLMYSSWTRRVWTLQEGALGKNLWVQLKDKAVDMDALSLELKQRYQTEFIHSPLLTQVYASLHRLRHSIRPAGDQTLASLAQLHLAVAFRSLSVASDEALCLATFFNLDQGAIVKAPPDDRLKAFWQAYGASTGHIPKNILFFTGPRLDQEGFRWSPATFLGAVNFFNLRAPKYFDELSTVHPHGLRVELPALEIVLSATTSHEDSQKWLDIFKGVPPICYARRDEGIWYTILLIDSPQRLLGLRIMDILQRNNGRNVLLLESDLDQPSQSNSKNDVCAALATSFPDDRAVVHAEETLHVLKCPSAQVMVLERTWQMSQDDNLRRLLQGFVTQPGEIPMRPDDEAFSRIPNAALVRLDELALIELQNGSLTACLGGDMSKKKDELMAKTLFCFSGCYAHIGQCWPSSQVWYVD